MKRLFAAGVAAVLLVASQAAAGAESEHLSLDRAGREPAGADLEFSDVHSPLVLEAAAGLGGMIWRVVDGDPPDGP